MCNPQKYLSAGSICGSDVLPAMFNSDTFRVRRIAMSLQQLAARREGKFILGVTIALAVMALLIVSAAYFLWTRAISRQQQSQTPSCGLCEKLVNYQQPNSLPGSVEDGKMIISIEDDSMLGSLVQIQHNLGEVGARFENHWTYDPLGRPLKPQWWIQVQPKSKSSYSVLVVRQGGGYNAWFKDLTTQYQRVQPFMPRCQIGIIKMAVWDDLTRPPKILLPDSIQQELIVTKKKGRKVVTLNIYDSSDGEPQAIKGCEETVFQ